MTRPGQPDLALEGKDAAVLAVLALDGPQPRQRLAAFLWPDVAPDRSRANLRQRLFRIKRVFGEAVVEGAAVLRLPAALAVDARDLAEHVRTAPDRPVTELLGALSFDELPELDAWLAAARARHRDAWRRLLGEMADAHEHANDWHAALRLAQRLLDASPLEEAAHRRVMRLQHLRGDRAAALAAHARCAESLRAELGVAPSAETESLRRLIESGMPPTSVDSQPVALVRPPILLGRDGAWLQLQRAHADRRCVLVTGEAGIGKTRLIGEFAAAQGDAVLTGARPGDEHQPYALFARLVRRAIDARGNPAGLDRAARAELARLLPELGDAAEGPLVLARLAWAVRVALQGWAGGGLSLVVLDDLHFADAASLALLLPLAGKGDGAQRETRLTWLLASRAAEMPVAVRDWVAEHASHELHAADTAASAGRVAEVDGRLRAVATVEQVALGPLGDEQVRELIESLQLPALDAQAWAPALARHTGGNPLFVLQTLGASLGAAGNVPIPSRPEPGRPLPLPPQVNQLIEQRLMRLSGDAQRLVRLAAVAAQSFNAELAAAVLGVPVVDLADAWQELEAAQILKDEGFAHDLIFEATRRGIPAAVQRALHAQVAVALQARAASAATLAAHWWAAERWREAASAHRRAATDARRLSDRAEEARCLGLAVEALARLHAASATTADNGHADAAAVALADERFDCTWELWDAARHVEPFDAQALRCDALDALVRTPVQRARALLARATLNNGNFKDQAALDAAEEASALAREAGCAELEFACLRQAVRALSRLNRPADVLALVERHVPGLTSAVTDASAPALVDFAAALIVSDASDRALLLLDAAAAQATQRRDWATLYDVHVHTAWAQFNLDRLEPSTNSYELARKLHARLGLRVLPHQHGMALARQYRALGRYRDALALLDEVLADHGRSAGFTLPTLTRSEQAIVYWQLGQHARVLQALKERPPADAAPSIRAAWLVTRARVAGVPQAEAVALVNEALAVIQAEGMQYYRVVLRGELAVVLPPELGLAEARAALESCRGERALIGQIRPALMRTCDILERLGRGEEALPLARELEAMVRQSRSTSVAESAVWWTISRVYAAADCPREAHHAWKRARDWLMETALPNVPPEFHHGFLHVNAINRAILTARVADLT